MNKIEPWIQKASFWSVVAAAVTLIIVFALFVFGRFDSREFTIDRLKLEQALRQESQMRNEIKTHQELPLPELYDLFDKWDTIMVHKDNLLEEQQKSAEQNLAIWLAVIAAICTNYLLFWVLLKRLILRYNWMRQRPK